LLVVKQRMTSSLNDCDKRSVHSVTAPLPCTIFNNNYYNGIRDLI
jgi:hypothetical protein